VICHPASDGKLKDKRTFAKGIGLIKDAINFKDEFVDRRGGGGGGEMLGGGGEEGGDGGGKGRVSKRDVAQR